MGKDEERKLLLAISQPGDRSSSRVFRFFANVVFWVIAALAICIASVSSWPTVTLAAGCLFVGLVCGSYLAYYSYAHAAHERWCIVQRHISQESVAARLNELGG